MSRSESLQTGTAQSPRILLPSADGRFVFTIGMRTLSSYPGAHPNAIEFMQWDAVQKNFRFHEVILADIPQMDADGDGIGVIAPRPRAVRTDDDKCSKCHSTRNVLNPGTTPEGSQQTLAQTAPGLQSGKAYYWKVIVEDGKGGTVESEMRRFDVR